MKNSMLQKCWLGIWLGWAVAAAANQIQVTELAIASREAGSHKQVRFALTWENSWRCDLAGADQGDPSNWDAAWVFLKYRVSPGDWRHATLAANGHVAPDGVTLDATADGMGAWVYRAANGSGTFTVNDAQLRWNHAADGVLDGDPVELKLFAIEMVYVPAGAFKVGSGGSGDSEFYESGTSSQPFLIASENAIAVGTSAGQLYYASTEYGGDRGGPIPAAFPKGYAAFYGMKTEISQGQYCDFLNTLTSVQVTNRYPEQSTYRHAVTTSGGAYTSANWYVACNFMSWADLTAYLDWAGLRPMTELEFEKACRGNRDPVPNEYAWGGTSITQATGIANAGKANETASNAGANAVYGSHASVQGPLRVGCLGLGSPGNRVATGAGYWGMLELSGNLWERPVTVGNAAGRAFTGLHGNGVLNVNGEADVPHWPGTNASGAGFRGRDWHNAASYLRAAGRDYAASAHAVRYLYYGGRGVRLAPRGVE